ncbi:ribosomal protein S2, flavodoxin-like domain-containing protein [Cladochytrium replicatum]|nr:ribosomal protein S2, flavodoxin-like domain-containing protein [Cladochytrium replicatum]
MTGRLLVRYASTAAAAAAQKTGAARNLPLKNMSSPLSSLPSQPPTLNSTPRLQEDPRALTLQRLLAANLHLGHSRASYHSHMLPFIYGERNGLHIINLEHTLTHLRRALNVTREVAMRNGTIVFVGTRLAIHRIAVDAAKRADAYYVTRWVGGTITNRSQVLNRSVVDESGGKSISASESGAAVVPDLVILLDYQNTLRAAREANQFNVPIIAICDTDCDPRRVQYPIPANDDSVAGVKMIADLLSLAAQEGQSLRDKVAQSKSSFLN